MKQTRVAVIGGGPTGLEAALALVQRGYDVTVYEAGRVGEHLRRFEWVRLFTPFAMNSSEEGRAALRVAGGGLPANDAILTAGELADRYLEPLARIPELRGRVREQTRVIAIGREGLSKGAGIVATGDRSRVGRPFLLRVAEAGRPECFERADVVIDASGVYATPRATGPGGLIALGEETLGDRIERHIPDLRGPGRARFAGRRVLLVGHGHSAATALLGLQTLADEGAGARVAWVHRATAPDADPFAVVAGDALPERRALATRANAIARGAPWLSRRAGAVVESYAPVEGAIRVTLRDESGAVTTLDVDRVLGLTGYRPDASLASELQVHLCYASEAPMALATALLTAALASPDTAGDCLSQTAHGAETLRTPEPGYFILGAKSYGRNSNFLLSVGRAQIEEVASLLEAERTEAATPIEAP